MIGLRQVIALVIVHSFKATLKAIFAQHLVDLTYAKAFWQFSAETANFRRTSAEANPEAQVTATVTSLDARLYEVNSTLRRIWKTYKADTDRLLRFKNAHNDYMAFATQH